MANRRGLSLGEVLIAVAIVAILVGMLLPATRRVREPAARAVCQNNLKQLMQALESYESTEHRPPYSQGYPAGCFGAGASPEERLSWMVALLPHLEQELAAQRVDPTTGYAGNVETLRTILKPFKCPSGSEMPADPITHYVAMAGLGTDAASRPAGAPGNGFMGYDRITKMNMIVDGTANTIAILETRMDLGPWARGGRSTLRGFDPAAVGDLPFGGHKYAFHAAMADGSVREVRTNVRREALAAAITIAGNESPSDFE